MIYTTNYLELAATINPLVFVEFLRQTGWTEIKRKRTDVKVFQREKEKELFQINLPMEKTLSDFQLAMFSAVEEVGRYEAKAINDVILSIMNPRTDILKAHLKLPTVQDGSIGLDAAVSLYQNAKNLLAATARDILRPSKFHQGRPDENVQKFLQSCRFGQTEIGSYVAVIICPFARVDENKQYQQLSVFDDATEYSDSFTRQVTTRVMNNISKIRKSIDEGSQEALLDDKSENIISSNFYEALMGMSLETQGAQLELQANWAPTVPPPKGIRNSVTVSYDYCEPIRSVIKKLHDYKKPQFDAVGRVTKLWSVPEVENRTSGMIQVVYLDAKGQAKKIETELTAEDYRMALKAHEEGRTVKLVGNIISEHPKRRMNCESFIVLD